MREKKKKETEIIPNIKYIKLTKYKDVNNNTAGLYRMQYLKDLLISKLLIEFFLESFVLH